MFPKASAKNSYWFLIGFSTHRLRHHRPNTDWPWRSQGWDRTVIKPQSTAYLVRLGLNCVEINHTRLIHFTINFSSDFSLTFFLSDENWKWTKTKKFFIAASLKNFRLDSSTLRCWLWRRKSWMKMWKCKLTTCYVSAREKKREKLAEEISTREFSREKPRFRMQARHFTEWNEDASRYHELGMLVRSRW